MTSHQSRLSLNDKSVLKFVDSTKRTRNWIRDIRFSKAILNYKGKIKANNLSKSQVEHCLRKLAKYELIKTEKWEQVGKRVYWK